MPETLLTGKPSEDKRTIGAAKKVLRGMEAVDELRRALRAPNISPSLRKKIRKKLKEAIEYENEWTKKL